MAVPLSNCIHLPPGCHDEIVGIDGHKRRPLFLCSGSSLESIFLITILEMYIPKKAHKASINHT